MEPTDQPPPQEQSWPQVPPWRPGPEPAPTPAPEPEVAPSAAAEPPATQAPAPPTGIVAERPTARWLVLAAVLTELVAIACANNQWVAKKAIDYAGGPQNGFAHQFVYSTQAFAWRLTKHTGESTSQWLAAFVGIAVLLVVSALLTMLLVRRGSFWRAATGSLLIVVFSTQVAGVVSGLVDGVDPRYVAFSGRYTPLINNGVLYGNSSQSGTFPGGGKATRALFDSPTGYRFVAGLTLGVLVAIVVGLVAKRFGAGPRQAQPVPPFFPPGEMQRSYEAGGAGFAEPGSAPPGTTLQPPAGGRHSRTD